MNFHDAPSPVLWWESNLWWVLACAMSVGPVVGSWLLWSPRQSGDGLLKAAVPGARRVPGWVDSAAWALMAGALMGPMLFVASWLMAELSLEPLCEVVAGGLPPFSYSPLPWFFAALGACVGGGVYVWRIRRPRDARDVLLAASSSVDPARLSA
ncbi:hypothetical protein A176_000019 [Myxococcus hansupus]|uniref:Uncharacterized protein n=1 Tax=Pseudomyxococcus hansupus TaxID=1297742 RepID=A0A0H4X5F5_9BACT|nr:hypothetical protein [Myxococcus hansupus]AKQ63107.1 hypothetical protein A176_000019 [Myxococcus hansupus]